MIRITEQLSEFIKNARAEGETYNSIAKRLGVTKSTVRNHALGLVKIRRCLSCGRIIQCGKYCRASCKKQSQSEGDKRRWANLSCEEKQKHFEKVRLIRDNNPERTKVMDRIRGSPRRRGAKTGRQLELTCTACGARFKRSTSIHRQNLKRGLKPYCSRDCARYHSRRQKFNTEYQVPAPIMNKLISALKSKSSQQTLVTEITNIFGRARTISLFKDAYHAHLISKDTADILVTLSNFMTED